MRPFWEDDWLTVYQGDCREVMRSMEPESVHCVVTSPPYWGLRDYGTASWEGGDEGCDHLGPPMRTNNKPTDSTATFHGGTNRSTEPWKDGTCGKCGARRQDNQLGLEPTPEEYVANMVAVFREVRRVLRADGTVWLNLGDSYAAQRSNSGQVAQTIAGQSRNEPTFGPNRNAEAIGLKHKDLVGIPWRVAFALQADGWYLRSDIIWSKPNPMPESVTDRPTKSHEYLFLLSKSARYYYDAEAVAEPMAGSSVARLSQPTLAMQAGSDRVPGKTNGRMKAVGKLTGGAYAPPGQTPSSNARPTWQDRKAAGAHPGGRGGPEQIVGTGTQRNVHGEGLTHDLGNGATRNLRSVWTVPTQPYSGAHFATFPPRLIEPCVKAGCPQLGTVLDPFAGSGTTGFVAQQLGRRAILIDLSTDYMAQILRRNAQMPLGGLSA